MTAREACDSEFNDRAIERVRLLLRRRARWLQQRWRRDECQSARYAVVSDQDLDAALAPEEAEAERRFFAGDAETRWLDTSIDTLGTELTQREAHLWQECRRRPAIIELTRGFALPDFGRDVLVLCLAAAEDERLARACAYLNDDLGRPFPTPALALKALVRDPAQRRAACEALRPLAALRRMQLIEWDGSHDGPLTRLAIDERIADYLNGSNRLDSRIDMMVEESRASLGADPAAVEVIRSQFRSATAWPRAALVGEPDVGAEETSGVAVRAMGWRLLRLDLEGLSAVPPRERRLTLALLGRDALLLGAAYYTDQPDEEHGEPARALAELCRVLEAPLLLRCQRNTPPGMTTIRLERPDAGAQHALWDEALGRAGQELNGAVREIVQQFAMGPRAIQRTVDTALAEQLRDGSTLSVQELWRLCRDQNAIDVGGLVQRIRPASTWGELVLPVAALSPLRDMADQVRHRSRVYGNWGFDARLGRGRGITALFAGESGTGKTMAAEVLARDLDLDLYRIDLAGVVSKYVGETEKQLRQVFDAAERCGAVLFFDEADALFGKRTEVRHSHDRYANIEVNYLLQRMEDYRGIAILATNRRDALDPAFLRRLRFVIDFPFPDLEHRRRLWEGAIPVQAAPAALDYNALSRLEVSGGHIRNIAVNAAFIAAGADRPIAMPDLMRAAAREYRKLGRPVSASEFGPFASGIRP